MNGRPVSAMARSLIPGRPYVPGVWFWRKRAGGVWFGVAPLRWLWYSAGLPDGESCTWRGPVLWYTEPEQVT